MANKNPLLIITIIILITVGAFFIIKKYSFAPAPINTSVNTAISMPTAINYYCQEGILSAVYQKTPMQVTITLPTQEKLTLPQAISADGARYADNTYEFWSKGDNAFLNKNNQPLFSLCVAGLLSPSATDYSKFTDAGNNYSFVFPQSFLIHGSDVGYTANWRQQATSSGLLLAVVTTPPDFMPKTNFGEATFTVGQSSDPAALKDCFTNPGFFTQPTTTVDINGINFTKLEFKDAAAGNLYETTSWRTVKNEACYAIEYTIHSGNIGNYPPDQGISEFDNNKIISIFDAIVQSFKFTN